MINGFLRTYTELSSLATFDERLRYLSLVGTLGDATFGLDRWINQRFYRSAEWKQVRNHVIMRDTGLRDHCQDLGVIGCDIFDKIVVHHMNPLRIDDFTEASDYLLNPEYLISTSLLTHNIIHFGNEGRLNQTVVERKPNDTCPWK